MSVTVGRLRSWRLFALEAAGDALQSALRTLDATVGDLEAAARVAEEAWQGDAALAALGRLREHVETGKVLVATITVIRRAVHAAADAFVAARGLLERAQGLADEQHLLITNDGHVRLNPLYLDPTVSHNPWAEREHIAWEAIGGTASTEPRFDTGPGREAMAALAAVQVLVTEALKAADEADTEAALAIRLARRLARDGQTGEPDDRALIALIGNRAAPAIGDDPALVAAWWATLSRDARDRWTQEHPELIGMLDGLPVTARDAANRLVLASELEDARGELAEFLDENEIPSIDRTVTMEHDDMVARVAMLESVEAGISERGRSLLLLDPTIPGRAAIAIGDVDTADHVAVLVPGFNSGVANYVPAITGDAERLLDQAAFELERTGDPSRVAAVAWIGYHAPMALDVAFDGDARDGAAYLQATLGGLDAAHAANGHTLHLTTVGHSYGSFVSGLAAQAGTPMDDLVLIGSPGSGVDSATALDVGPLHVYAGAAGDDWISYLSHFGPDPTTGEYGGQVFGVDGGPVPGAPGVDLAPAGGHSDYYGRGTESLTNIANIVVGHPENASLTEPRGRE